MYKNNLTQFIMFKLVITTSDNPKKNIRQYLQKMKVKQKQLISEQIYMKTIHNTMIKKDVIYIDKGMRKI